MLHWQNPITKSGNRHHNPDPSAKLDITSTNTGLLVPRMTNQERDAIIAPAKGLIVFVIPDSSFYYYNGTAWKRMLPEGEAWGINGNNNTTGF